MGSRTSEDRSLSGESNPVLRTWSGWRIWTPDWSRSRPERQSVKPIRRLLDSQGASYDSDPCGNRAVRWNRRRQTRIAVAVITGPADQDGEVKTRTFGTTVPALEKLREWLIQEGCTSVAMESTGSYWIPVKNILEVSVKIVLVCAKKHKPERGEKTDFRDAKNLAHLHRHGLLKGSYLPDRAIVELRDLTRRRKKLLSNLSAEKNRIQKVLEVANIKIGNIINDVFGVSGQAMVSALMSGKEITAEQIAELSKRRLRQRIPELKEALERHQMNDHHRWLIQQSVDHAILLDRQLEELEARDPGETASLSGAVRTAADDPGRQGDHGGEYLAEIGRDMSPVSVRPSICQLGRDLSWKQPVGRQE